MALLMRASRLSGFSERDIWSISRNRAVDNVPTPIGFMPVVMVVVGAVVVLVVVTPAVVLVMVVGVGAMMIVTVPLGGTADTIVVVMGEPGTSMITSTGLM